MLGAVLASHGGYASNTGVRTDPRFGLMAFRDQANVGKI